MCLFRVRFEVYFFGYSLYFSIFFIVGTVGFVLCVILSVDFFFFGFLFIGCFVVFLRLDFLIIGEVIVLFIGLGIFLFRFLGLRFRFFLGGVFGGVFIIF